MAGLGLLMIGIAIGFLSAEESPWAMLLAVWGAFLAADNAVRNK